MPSSRYDRWLRHCRPGLLAVTAGILIAGCHSRNALKAPSIQITRVPQADPGGPVQMGYIEGSVRNADAGQQVVLYANSGGVWWIQPYMAHPRTVIQPDSTWKNATHLGTRYAALLVGPDYRVSPRMSALPDTGNGVVATATLEGKTIKPIQSKVIRFSGYEWAALAAGSNRGGEANIYDPANVWTDEKGYLHLRMGLRDGQWTCAEVNLTRSLGYGTYRFVVQDSAHLEPSAVLGMFTLDLTETSEDRSEVDIELGRWGNPNGKNAQYVIQPFYVPENVARFTAPAGVLTHTVRWEPGTASFKTTQGPGSGEGAKTVNSHVFSTGVPSPAAASVHIDLFDFHHSRNPDRRPAEVVIEKFEYLP